jgi:hypothetical protein
LLGCAFIKVTSRVDDNPATNFTTVVTINTGSALGDSVLLRALSTNSLIVVNNGTSHVVGVLLEGGQEGRGEVEAWSPGPVSDPCARSCFC